MTTSWLRTQTDTFAAEPFDRNLAKKKIWWSISSGAWFTNSCIPLIAISAYASGLAMVDTLLHHYQRLWRAEATQEILICTRTRTKHPIAARNFGSLSNLANSPYLPGNSSFVPKHSSKVLIYLYLSTFTYFTLLQCLKKMINTMWKVGKYPSFYISLRVL